MYTTKTRSFQSLLAPVALLMIAVAPQRAAADTMTLAWDPSTDSGVVGYVLHIGTQSGTYTQHIDVEFSTIYGWNGAVAGQRYCFAVSGYDAGYTQTPMSNEVCGYSNAYPVLLNPGNLSSTVGQSTSLQLQGNDPDGQPVSYSAAGLPPGLWLGASTGFISGTPTTTGTYTVVATVSDGALSASQTFTWTITSSVSTSTSGDTSPPTLNITSPTSASTYATSASTLSLSGTAGDNVGVTQVVWTNDRGGSGTASGTASWSVGSITLADGSNNITVTARDAAGNTASDVITVTFSSTTSGSTSDSTSSGGLLGEYYSGRSFDTLITTRIDPTVDFGWSYGSPADNVASDDFSVRWTGSVLAPVTGTYKFSTLSDDGVRLWIGDALVIDNWTDHGPTTDTSSPVRLQGGQRYAVRLEYYDHWSYSVVQLKWSVPGQTTQVIPQSALLPPVSVAGLRGDYYSGSNFDSLITTRIDPTVDFEWGYGSADANQPVDNFSVRWTGMITVPVTGTYTFVTSSDDGVRLWVGNQLMIDNWTDHGSVPDASPQVSLQAGQQYPVRLEYYENTGWSVMQLYWTYPGQSLQIIPQSALTSTP